VVTVTVPPHLSVPHITIASSSDLISLDQLQQRSSSLPLLSMQPKLANSLCVFSFLAFGGAWVEERERDARVRRVSLASPSPQSISGISLSHPSLASALYPGNSVLTVQCPAAGLAPAAVLRNVAVVPGWA
jgi:hypothetical protein